VPIMGFVILKVLWAEINEIERKKKAEKNSIAFKKFLIESRYIA
jgi:hypothetical protein